MSSTFLNLKKKNILLWAKTNFFTRNDINFRILMNIIFKFQINIELSIPSTNIRIQNKFIQLIV
jgi:hypothetical protein